jgi:hypothetical protein
MRAVVWAKRRGQPTPIVETFSVGDADAAGLTKKRTNRDGQAYDSTYEKYLKDMLRSRARGRALDQGFSDVLSGMDVEGVAEDIADDMVARGEANPGPPAQTVVDPLAASLEAKAKAQPAQAVPEVLTVEPLPEDDDDDQQDEIDASVEEALPSAPAQAAAPAIASAPERCPRCKTKVNAMGGCDMCGWPTTNLGKAK